MKSTIILLVSFFFLQTLAAQPLYKHPFLTYLGPGLETMKVGFTGMPYHGIGKRTLMEQLPESWAQRFNRVEVPTSNFVDAFGAVLPSFNYNADNKSMAIFQTDRFGTLSADISNRAISKRNVFTFSNRLHLQKRWSNDLNDNNLHDFQPGNRLVWWPGVSFNNGRLNATAALFHLRFLELGGQKEYTGGSGGGVPNYYQEGRNLQAVVRGTLRLFHWRSHLEWTFDHKRHWEERALWSKHYEGKERQWSGMVAFKQDFQYAHYSAGAQFSSDKTEEKLDAFRHSPEDKFWKFFGNFDVFATKYAVLKGFANLEKHDGQGWRFFPNGQLDISLFEKKSLVISLFGSTGQQLAKPLNYHFDWLALGDGMVYEVEKFEKASKFGAAFSMKKGYNEEVMKLSFDRTRFGNKAIVRFDEEDKQLIFSTLNEPLHRTAIEWMGYMPFGEEKYFDAHLIYRWEHFSKNNLIPFQSAHSLQLRSRFKKNDWAVQAHYTLKSPQNLPLLSDKTPSYHRLDLSVARNIELNGNGEKLAFQNLEIGLLWDNAFNFFRWKNALREGGLPLLPVADDFLWNEQMAGNVKLRVGVGLGK